MPEKLHWSEAADTVLRRARAEGCSWDTIAAVLGVSRWTAIHRGQRIGARRPPPDPVPADLDPKPDPFRPPLPAGHPVSWGLLTAGTCLEGTPYPEPEDGPAPIDLP
jgi:hypothetical protein